jgi:DNA polymerase kappa
MRNDTPYERKSISSERTFKSISDKEELLLKCKEIAENLSENVAENQLSGKCLTLKLKFVDFSIKQRSVTLPT